ncbi:hypothetical protein INR49_030220, partial [Caranx melampygus]
MSMRYLGFVLLMWIPVLHAQTTQSCEPPTLDGGYFFPDEDIYLHGALLTYACEKGLKPSVEGWWASSTCENGKWVHEPQCIDEQDCILPTIPNGQNTENVTVFKNGDTLHIKCNKGYDHKDDVATARCENGEWSSLPICEKNATACGHPPKVPHAVILQQGYMEVFPAGTEVLYICEDGYAIEGTHASIFCKAGDWEKEPTCSQPPPINTGTNEREISVSVSKCGTHPTIEHGDILEADAKFLRIWCNVFYRRVGPEKVMCYTDGTWSWLCRKKTDVKACIPPSIPNGHYTENSNGWYEEGYTMRTECDQGYEHRDSLAVTRCVAGEWTSLPICENVKACIPPSIPNGHYTENSNGWYEEGYTMRTECDQGYEHRDSLAVTRCVAGEWTSLPICEISVSKCGTHPTIEHGDIVEVDAMFLRIRCNASYNLVGPEKVVCYTDGTWSQLPICQGRGFAGRKLVIMAYEGFPTFVTLVALVIVVDSE